MLRLPYSTLLGLTFVTLAGCQKKNDSETGTTAKRTEFFDVSGMDTTVAAGDDFFEYANGGWIKKTKIPDDQTSWGASKILYEGNQKKTKAILDEAAASNAAKGATEQKVGDFYASGLDSTTIEKRGYEPLKPRMAQIAALTGYKDALRYMAADSANRGANCSVSMWEPTTGRVPSTALISRSRG